jgi:hypothetical protein
LPSASAPEIITGLLPVLESNKWERRKPEKKKMKFQPSSLLRRTPIGLFPVDREGWLNAMMQFILFVPGFVELFVFAPRSFASIQDFIDHYRQDQKEDRPISRANGNVLYDLFAAKISSLSLFNVLRYLMAAVCPTTFLYSSLNEALKDGQGSDLFVTESCKKRQIFSDRDVYYDLDAFIERRPDGLSHYYVAYVKVDASWYQCDDERITQIRSDILTMPLERAVLLHFRRQIFAQTRWS